MASNDDDNEDQGQLGSKAVTTLSRRNTDDDDADADADADDDADADADADA